MSYLRTGMGADRFEKPFSKCFKVLLLKFLFIFCATTLLCCHGGHHHNVLAAENGTPVLRVVASTFPVYLFTKNICANSTGANVELLIPAVAGCPHDYALTPADMQKLAKADVLVINGWGLEDFLEKAIQKVAPKVKIIDAGKNVPVIEEGDDAINPHIFAAPKQAAIMSRNIARELAELDPINAALYHTNSIRYANAMEDLNARFIKLGESAANKKIALEHDALSYLAANADLEVVAMVEGNSSAAALIQLKKTLQEAKPALLAGDAQYSDRLLKTLAKETELPFALLNPCASGPEDAPLNYYESTMENNLKILGDYY